MSNFYSNKLYAKRYLKILINFKKIWFFSIFFREKGFKQQDINMIKDAVINPETNPKILLELHSPIAALDLAYDYARFVAAKEKSDLPHLSKRSMQLLSLRSKQGKAKELSIPPPPARDDQGHKTGYDRP